jgi:FkbM family methyltransferase
MTKGMRTLSASLRRFAWRAGRSIYCAARGEQRSGDIARNGEAYVQACVVKAVPASERLHVLDIGANQGEWTLCLLRQLSPERCDHSLVKIDLFEPVPITTECLGNNLFETGLAQLAEIHPIALSESVGAGSIAIMSETGGTNTMHFEGPAAASPPGGWVEVPISTVTEFCRSRGINHVHLAKCDTEGNDVSVLRGARKMLVEGRIDVFQFEYNHRWVYSRTYFKDVFELIEGLPYRVARVDPYSIEVLPGWHPELDRFFQSNYVLVHENALAWFDVRHGHFDASNTLA